MKLIKLIMVGLVTLTMVIAQNQQEGQGPPPCDEWLNSDMAHDMNGDGEVNDYYGSFEEEFNRQTAELGRLIQDKN